MILAPILGYYAPNPYLGLASGVVASQLQVQNLYNQLNYDILRLNAAKTPRQRRNLERVVSATENRLAQATNELASRINTAAAYSAYVGPYLYGAYATPAIAAMPYFYGFRPAAPAATPGTQLSVNYNRNWV